MTATHRWVWVAASVLALGGVVAMIVSGGFDLFAMAIVPAVLLSVAFVWVGDPRRR